MNANRPIDRNTPRNRVRSFTLIELLVVIAIIVILSGGMMLGFQRIFGTTALQEATNEIVALIAQGRTLAYTQKVPHMLVINGGDNTVTLYSAGPDGVFATDPTFQDDARDDEVVASFDLDDITTNDRIVVIKALTEYNETDLLEDEGERAEASSGAFIFTQAGVRYGLRPGDEADDEAIVTLDATLRVATDIWEAGTDGDIILYLAGEEGEKIMIRVGPVRGYVETKIKAEIDI